MAWFCKICGKKVGDSDMCGYFTDKNGAYVSGSLGFWHNSPQCGRQAECSLTGTMPHECQISDFKKSMPQFIALYVMEAKTQNFRDDCARFILQCYQDGYNEIMPHIDAAIQAGIIETNLPSGLVWDDQVEAIKKWLQED